MVECRANPAGGQAVARPSDPSPPRGWRPHASAASCAPPAAPHPQQCHAPDSMFTEEDDLHRRALHALVTRAGLAACSAVRESVVTASPRGTRHARARAKIRALMSVTQRGTRRECTRLAQVHGPRACRCVGLVGGSTDFAIGRSGGAAECRDKAVGVRQSTCIPALFPLPDCDTSTTRRETHISCTLGVRGSVNRV